MHPVIARAATHSKARPIIIAMMSAGSIIRMKPSIRFTFSTLDGETKSVSGNVEQIIDQLVNTNFSKLNSTKIESNISLSQEDVIKLIPLIGPNLIRLELPSLGLCPKCIKVLTKKLEKSKLETLDIGNNPIGDASVWMLIDFLGRTTSIVELNISNCEITAQGLWPMLNSLAVRPFHVLDISKNKIGYLGADYIRQFLIVKPKITRLIANKTNLSESELYLIIESAKKAPQTEIYLLNNATVVMKEIPPNVHVSTSIMR